MSGGAFQNIQYRDGEDFLQESALVKTVERMAKQLTSYGPEGFQAALATQQLHDRMVQMREQIAAMNEELSQLVEPLQSVWRMVDYHYCNDVGKDDVLKELKKYTPPQANIPASAESVETQPYVYKLPENLASMTYDELFVEDYVSNYRIGPALNAMGLPNKTVCPVCCVDDFIHVEGCSKLKLIEDI